MSEAKHPEVPAIHRHEVHDAETRYVMIFIAVIAVTVALTMWISKGLFYYFVHHEQAEAPAFTFPNAKTLPPSPELEPVPHVLLEKYLGEEQNELDGYGWVDRSQGIVHIPVDQAIQLVLQKGLPVASSEALKKQGPLEPGEVQQYTLPEGYTPQAAPPER
jgi:hypothetical protein